MPPKNFPENVTYIGKFLDDEANITYKYASMGSCSINKSMDEKNDENLPTATFSGPGTKILAEDLLALANILEEDQQHGPCE